MGGLPVIWEGMTLMWRHYNDHKHKVDSDFCIFSTEDKQLHHFATVNHMII